MVRVLGLVALAALCGASTGYCQSSAPARGGPADSDEIKPPPLEDPAAVPGWAAHAIDRMFADPDDHPDNGHRRKSDKDD